MHPPPSKDSADERLGVCAPASVTNTNGDVLAAQVSKLLPTSLVLRDMPIRLSFRERITVELFGHIIPGEVVFSNDREAAVVFETTPDIFEAIETFEDFVVRAEEEAAPADPQPTIDMKSGFGSLGAVPQVEDGRIVCLNDLDRLAMLIGLKAGRPQLVQAEQALARVLLGDAPPVELVAIPVGQDAYVLHPPTDSGGLDRALKGARSALDGVVMSTPRDSTQPDPDDLPTVGADGAVAFRSHEQFRIQHSLNLANGAVMALGSGYALGQRRSLILVIPKAQPIEVQSAEVVFTQDGKVGFSVADVDSFRSQVLARLSPGVPQAAARPDPQVRAPQAKLKFDSALSGLPTSLGVFDLRKGPFEDLSAAGGWYVGLLDRVLRSGYDALVKITHEDSKMKVWVHDHRVVAVERFPPPEKDRLGERLLASRAIDAVALEHAVDAARMSKRPFGQVILSSGAATRASVHRELRKQIMDRLLAPCEWASGKIAISDWSDPPVDADLLPVSGDAVVTALLRKQLQQTRLAVLREELTPMLNRKAVVDLAKISEGFRLTERELRFYQRGADANGSLATLVSLVKSRPLEGYRLVLLGAALGFISFPLAVRSA